MEAKNLKSPSPASFPVVLGASFGHSDSANWPGYEAGTSELI